MSIVRTRKLKRLGIKTKSEVRKARKYVRSFVKCNRAYAYQNIATNLGYNDIFWVFAEKLNKHLK